MVRNRNPDPPWQAIVKYDVAAEEFNHCNYLKSKVEKSYVNRTKPDAMG
jgi:hypothetical protein